MGGLTVELPGGKRLVHRGPKPGPDGVMIMKNWRPLRRLAIEGDIGYAESYIQGDWTSPDISHLIELVALNYDTAHTATSAPLLSRIMDRLHHKRRVNTRTGSRRNIVAHYDLGNDFYKLWLDKDMVYSSALYAHPGQSLEQAQDTKLTRLTDALAIKGGERVLEIGIGWGALAERIIRKGAHVTGLTLSPSQLDYARRRMEQARLADRADLRLQDYRDVDGVYDRIVSVEMLEAVGEEYWKDYFSVLRNRLAPEGVAAVQVITIDDRRFETYRRAVDFIQRYIFPGGMLPSPGIIQDQASRAGLKMLSVETFGQSYVRTLAEWNRRFQDAWPAIENLGFKTDFKRMWEYYLSYCEGAFRAGAIDVAIYRLAPETNPT
jgi:cyclopropane-fatty-acyl-phospholipid synthase